VWCAIVVWVLQEFGKHEREPDKCRRLWQGQSRRTGESFSCSVGPERFLAAEVRSLSLPPMQHKEPQPKKFSPSFFFLF